MSIRSRYSPCLPDLAPGRNLAVPPTDWPAGARRILGVDLGWAAPTAVVTTNLRPDGRLFVTAAHQREKTGLAASLAAQPRSSHGRRTLVAFGPDASQHRAEQPTSASEQVQRMGFAPVVIRRPVRDRLVALLAAIAMPDAPILLTVSPYATELIDALSRYAAEWTEDGRVTVHTPEASHLVDACSYAVLAAHNLLVAARSGRNLPPRLRSLVG